MVALVTAHVPLAEGILPLLAEIGLYCWRGGGCDVKRAGEA